MSKKINEEILRLWKLDDQSIDDFTSLFPKGANLIEAYYGLKTSNKHYLRARICEICSISSDKQFHSQTQAIGGFKEKMTAVDYGTAISGSEGESYAGKYGMAMTKCYGIAVAGFMGTAIAEDFGLAIAGVCGTAKAGYWGIAIVGKKGQAIAEDRGIAISGLEGTAIVSSGFAFVGEQGIAIADEGGTVSAGVKGKIMIRTTNFKEDFCKMGYIGKDGLKPQTSYKLDHYSNFVEAEIDTWVEEVIMRTNDEQIAWARSATKFSDFKKG